MEDDKEETKEALLNLFISLDYIDYCKKILKNVKFEYENELLSPREIDKIIKTLADLDDDTKWKKLINKIVDLADNDNKYIEWNKRMQITCEQCGHYPLIKEKISKYHPEWIRVQKEREKIINDEEEKIYLRVEKESCEQCGNIEYSSCGIDKNPEEGLRG